ncbi:NifB/NifX family molybdenum-iron cluster-binding protein [bacterium]|nr:NifB/NifX family molybdenum-iron cluster-binding protein [bacterium]
MKICIPTSEGKLCGHFGHCESFTFAEVNPDTKEILNIEERVPEEGISCQSAGWISEQGVSKVLAGGMGGRPLMMFAQNGIEVVAGCPELPVREIVEKYLSNTLETGENACGGEGHDHHHCHGHHGEGHHCGH